MSVTSKQISPMRFNTSFGNYLPPEYENSLQCDCCSKIENTMNEITPLNDYHVCSDCLASWVDDMVSDASNGDDDILICTLCGENFTTSELFVAHLNFTHINEKTED